MALMAFDFHRAPRAVTLHVEVVGSLDGLVALEPEWTRLVEDAGLDHPFLSHEWIVSWWGSFGEGRELRILVARAGGEAVAIAPLMASTRRWCGAKVRFLELIGNDHTPRGDLIVGRRSEEGYAALWGHLRKQSGSWDVLVLPRLPEDSATRAQMEQRARVDGYLTGVWPGGRSPFVRLPADWNVLVGSLHRKQRANLRQRRARLETVGTVELETMDSAFPPWSAVEEGFRLEAAAWKRQAGTAVLSDPRRFRFYSTLAARAARRGWLRLQFLRVGGRRIAFHYSLLYRGCIFLLKPGYDPKYASYAPGSMLCSLVLQDACRKGLAVLDLLGDDEPWKRQWTDRSRAHVWLYVLADRPPMRLLHALKFRLLPRLQRSGLYRRLRDRLVAGLPAAGSE